MDFADTPAEAAFRAEVRALARRAPDRRVRRARPGRRPGRRDRLGRADRVGEDARRRPLGRAVVARASTAAAAPTSRSRSSSTRSTRAANAPARISFFGEGLFAPTLIQFGTDEQKQRFLPKIQRVDELWCQGFSEPNAGSDLANIQTRAVLDGDEWVITGQKVWTTLAHRADWCFVVCRTDPESTSHHGLSYLLVPDGPAGYRGAAAAPDHRAAPSSTKCSSTARAPRRRTCSARSVRAGRSRWRRSASSAGPRSCRRSSASSASSRSVLDVAHKNGAASEPALRDELARRYIGLQVMKYNGMRMLTDLRAQGRARPRSEHRQAVLDDVAQGASARPRCDVLGADALCVEQRRRRRRTSSTSCSTSS